MQYQCYIKYTLHIVLLSWVIWIRCDNLCRTNSEKVMSNWHKLWWIPFLQYRGLYKSSFFFFFFFFWYVTFGKYSLAWERMERSECYINSELKLWRVRKRETFLKWRFDRSNLGNLLLIIVIILCMGKNKRGRRGAAQQWNSKWALIFSLGRMGELTCFSASYLWNIFCLFLLSNYFIHI